MLIEKKQKLRVGLIARGLTGFGVERFLRVILTEFKNYNSEIDFFIFVDDQKYVIEFNFLTVILIKCKIKIIWDYLLSPFILRKHHLDVIIYPKTVIPLSNYFLSAKKILIVHDLGYLIKGKKIYPFWENLYVRFLFCFSVNIADKIMAVSQFTKDDIINHCQKNKEKVADKISVIYEGVASFFKKNVDPRQTLKILNLPLPIIFGGRIDQRKNALNVLKAFNEIKEEVKHNLIFIGKEEELYRSVKNVLKNKNLRKRVFFYNRVSEQELVDLYSVADLFLYVSLFEGFGLQILEAQACGCPVITSNVTSCPEVAGIGSGVVDPYSVEEIKKEMLKILQNREYRETLVKNGFENLKRFNWTETVAQLIKMVKIL